MPAPLKGLLIAASVIVAAGIAVYESPQVQEWMDRARRKITTALHELSDLGERPAPSRRTSADSSSNSTRRGPSEEEIAAAVDAARRKRDETLARNPELFSRRARANDDAQSSRPQQSPPPYQAQQQPQPQPQRFASSSSSSSSVPPRAAPHHPAASTDKQPSAAGFATFDDLLKGDGAGAYILRNSSTEPGNAEQTLRRRNNANTNSDNSTPAAAAAAAAPASGLSSAGEPAARRAASVIPDGDRSIIAPELREWQASRSQGSDAHDTPPADEPLIQLESQPPSRASSAVPVVTPTSSAAGDHHWAHFSPSSSMPVAEQEHVRHAASAAAPVSHPQAAEVPPVTTSGSTYFSINEWAESATPTFQRHTDTDLGTHASNNGGSNSGSDGVQSGSPSPPNGRQLRPTPISVPTSDIAPQDSRGRRGDAGDGRSAAIDHSVGDASDTDHFGNSDADDDDDDVDYGAQTRLADEVLSFTTGTAASTSGVRTPGTWTEVGSEVSENDIGP